jgi:hypothetical protein
MRDKYEVLKEDVIDEEKAIEETLKRLKEIRDRYACREKDYLIEPAMGTYLMNFYNGIENILKRISKECYATMPSGESWHKELLLLSSNPPGGMSALFDEDLVSKLHPYRNFRHRFISGYGFQLKAEKMLELIDDSYPLWDNIKAAISCFLKKL